MIFVAPIFPPDASAANLVRQVEKTTAWLTGKCVGENCWSFKGSKGGTSTPLSVLARDTFSGAEEDVSVYFAVDHVAEVAIAAALNLRRRDSAKEPVTLLRIPSWITTQLGITVSDKEKGTTGVEEVDLAHRNLFGSAEHYRRLTTWLLVERCAGLDLVRSIQAPSLASQYARFVDLPDAGVKAGARESARSLLQRILELESPR